jgi:hypothetical protein
VILGLASACATQPPATKTPATRPLASASAPSEDEKADTDGDNIFGLADQCPDELEVYNGWGDEDGCPDRSHSHDPVGPLSKGRSVSALLAISSKVELYADAGEEKDKSLSLAAERLNFTHQLLIDRGVPAERLAIASEDATGGNRIRFRVLDKSLIRRTYTCYPGP